MPEEILQLAGGASFVEISAERLDLFDTDVLLWLVDNETQRDEIRPPSRCWRDHLSVNVVRPQNSAAEPAAR